MLLWTSLLLDEPIKWLQHILTCTIDCLMVLLCNRHPTVSHKRDFVTVSKEYVEAYWNNKVVSLKIWFMIWRLFSRGFISLYFMRQRRMCDWTLIYRRLWQLSCDNRIEEDSVRLHAVSYVTLCFHWKIENSSCRKKIRKDETKADSQYKFMLKCCVENIPSLSEKQKRSQKESKRRNFSLPISFRRNLINICYLVWPGWLYCICCETGTFML